MTFIVPETAELERVRTVIQAIRDELSPHDVSGLSSRQTGYALQTAVALSLAERSGREYALTASGSELLSQRWGSDDAKERLRSAITSTDLFKAIPNLLDADLDVETLARLLEEKAGLSVTTARKRAAALRKWPGQLVKSSSESMSDDIVTGKRVALIHLSDIHILQPSDAILARASEIANAVSGRLDIHAPAACVVTVTGDVSQSGRAGQYELAERFFSELKDGLSTGLSCAVHLVFVPGNHDCDVEDESAVRHQLLTHLKVEEINREIFQTVSNVQEEFVNFRNRLGAPVEPEGNSSPGILHSFIEVSGYTLRFDLYNTAWCSKKKEVRGSLLFPEPTRKPGLKDGDAVVAMLHHPSGWLTSHCARLLRGHLRQTADLVLTGHEHVPDQSQVVDGSGQTTEYYEGMVLHERGDDSNSGFSVQLLDFGESTQEYFLFGLGEDLSRYELRHRSPARAFLRAKQKLRNQFTIQDEFRQFLRDPGEALKHSKKPILELSDVFVPPELRPTFMSRKQDDLIGDSLEYFLKQEKILILGGDLAGKTSLAKWLFLKLLDEGKVPVFIKGTRITDVDSHALEELRETAFCEQYGKSAYERYVSLPAEQKAVIIDDADRSPLPKSDLECALSTLTTPVKYAAVLADEGFTMELLDVKCSPDRGVLSFEAVQIQPFGEACRYQLVQKWCYIGRSSADDDDQLSRRAQQVDELLGKAMGSSLLPTFPCLILLCLQQVDASKDSALADGSFGHLYDALVTTNLSLNGTATIDVGAKRTVLSEVAHAIYEGDGNSLAEEEWERLFAEYVEEYDSDKKSQKFLTELLQSNLLRQDSNGAVSFRYKYSYCLFAASYFLRNLSEEELQAQTARLCADLYNEESANILLFLAHFDQDGPVCDGLIRYGRELLEEQETFDLHKTLTPLGNSPQIRTLTLDADTPEERRDLERSRRDEAGNGGVPFADDLPSEVVRFIKGLRTVHILGQVLKSSSGTMKAERKAELLTECYELGLRNLASIVSELVADHAKLAADVGRLLVQHRPELEGDLSAVREEVLYFINHLCRGVVYNSTLHMAHSVGAASLVKTYNRVHEGSSSPMFSLFDLAIRLDHFTGFPSGYLRKLEETFKNKPAPQAVLRLLVFRHLYLFKTDYRLRQELCARYDIKQNDLLAKRLRARRGL